MNTVPDVVLDFLSRVEGLRLVAYEDHGGRGWVCGRGHSNGAGQPFVDKDTVWTSEYAEEVFLNDVKNSYREVLNIIKSNSLTELQMGALTSVDFNMGATNFKQTRIVQFINNPSITNHLLKAADAFLDDTETIDKNTGVERTFLGLRLRRIVEASFFLQDVWPPQIS